MVQHVACVVDDGVGDVGHGGNALHEFGQGIAVFPPLAHAVGAGHHAEHGRGDAFVNGLGLIGFEQLGVDRQVLAVTHLPQVAACADQHLVVAKRLQGQTTESSVTEVVNADRVNEIARMLGGSKVTEATISHATEMIAIQAINTPAKGTFLPLKSNNPKVAA